MQFITPGTKTKFDISDEWWAFAEMNSFQCAPGGYYPYRLGDADQIEIVSIEKVRPPLRDAGVPLFKKYKMMPVLFAFTSPECVLPAVDVCPTAGSGGLLDVLNGYHRFYASCAVGYGFLPVRKIDRFRG